MLVNHLYRNGEREPGKGDGINRLNRLAWPTGTASESSAGKWIETIASQIYLPWMDTTSSIL